MKTGKKKKIYRIIGVILIVILIAGCFTGFVNSDRQEPVNPITSSHEELKAEILDGKASLDLEEEDEEGSDKKKESDDNDKSKEKQDSKQNNDKDQQEEEDPEKEPEQDPEEGAPESESDPVDNNNDGSTDDMEGDTPGEEGDSPDKEANTGDDDGTQDSGLVTDLSSRIIAFSELSNDTLEFYAYYSDPRVDSNIKVSYRHESDNSNGRWLKGQGRNYSVKLAMGKNIIVVYYTDDKGVRNYASFTIRYEADKADENNPVQGKNPPVITTNLDNWQGDIKTQQFTFTVKARTWQGKQIYSDHITVQKDGKTITNPTGNSTYEYVLYFKKPVKGETSRHKITVLAWDDEGNSRFVKFEVVYRSIDEGDVIGQVRVVVDATTVNKGIIADEVVDIVQGRPASYTILEALDVMNLEYEYAGTKDNGFYLRSIQRGNAFRNAKIPDNLRELIERDGLEFRNPCTKNRLGEFDFTQGSGWLYCVNNGAYSGKGLSEWFLNDGDTIYFRFTLARGKDIGAEDVGYGRLQGYCGLWINGGFIQLDHDYKVERKDPTETKDGYIERTCKKCEHTEKEILPATGRDDPDPPEDNTKPTTPTQPPQQPTEPEQPAQPEEPTEENAA